MKDYKRYFEFDASPEAIYSALTNNEVLEIWTGEKAVMSPEVNTEFSLWDDAICGKNLAFEPNFKIVQEWYFGEQSEPSIVTIKLHPGNSGTGTSMEVRQTNIPQEAFSNIKEGWEENYFSGLSQLYNE